MARMPKLSGADVIKILERKGYAQVRTRGSHVRLYPPEYLVNAKKVTVPLHKQLKQGTLMNIMRCAGLSAEDLQ